jgi:phosphatidate cytidylyltransferase
VSDLKKRLISAIVFGPIVVLCFYFLPLFPFFIFIYLVAFFAVCEGLKISEPKMKYLILLSSLLSLLLLYFKRFEIFTLWLLFFSFLSVTLHMLVGRDDSLESPMETLRTVVTNLVTNVFIVLPLYYLYALKELDDIYPLVLLLTVWGSDVSAYLIGKRFGKRKLAPKISPGKTVEGLLGALLGSAVVLTCFHRIVQFGLEFSIALGFIIGFLGQVGDIFESAVKRCFGIKDSSKIIPGHGGILDRTDSFLFTAPFLHAFLSYTR